MPAAPPAPTPPHDTSALLECLSTAVLDLGPDGRLRWLNSAAESLLEASVQLASGRLLPQLFMEAGRLEEALQRAAQGGQPYTDRALELVTQHGHALTVDCTVTPLPEGGGMLLEMRQVDRERRIARDAQLLAQEEAARALLRGVAHEVKNPLGGIRGAAQLLEAELPRAALREYTQVIIEEADRLQTLVDRMLGPRRTPRHEAVNVHELLERVRMLILAEAPPGVSVRRDYDPSLPDLSADRDYLQQALLNLARNALEAVGARGVIRFRTRAERAFHIGPHAHRLGLRVQIEDDGPGVPAELREKIFYPMVTGKPNGTGLGLAIAQSLAQRHGGLIECDSRPGRTVFTLLLPLEAKNGGQNGLDH
jgi:two-component system nitrogen regulation sensor histidine kinase GlnL